MEGCSWSLRMAPISLFAILLGSVTITCVNQGAFFRSRGANPNLIQKSLHERVYFLDVPPGRAQWRVDQRYIIPLYEWLSHIPNAVVSSVRLCLPWLQQSLSRTRFSVRYVWRPKRQVIYLRESPEIGAKTEKHLNIEHGSTAEHSVTKGQHCCRHSFALL
jgi:hypothetical protein